MRTKFFFFAMLAGVTASATIKVTPLSTDYSTNKVTFKVEWTNAPSAPYNNRVWVWVDFCTVTGSTPANSFSTATVSTPTIIGGNSTITNVTFRGFFIEYGATNSGTTVTAILSNASGKFNWCAYGSDYPPNVLTNTNGFYTLAGTPPFKLIASNGITTQTVNENTIAITAISVAPATITDATGYPGLWCLYTGNDLYMDDTHRCLRRQSGAQNWEAWIKNSRDNELYRIVLMPDNNWWLAQNIKFAGTGAVNSSTNCTPDKCRRLYTGDQMSSTYTGSTGTSGYGANKQGVCPNNWILPVYANWRTFVDAIDKVELTSYDVGKGIWLLGNSSKLNLQLAGGNNPFVTGNNFYGWASEIWVPIGCHESWRSNDMKNADWGLMLNCKACCCDTCNENLFTLAQNGNGTDRAASVRCFRQL